jgi:hypothetical protein
VLIVTDLFNNVVTFRIADASINLPTFDMGHSGDIYFEFKTTVENAVIIHSKGPTDYIKISIIGKTKVNNLRNNNVFTGIRNQPLAGCYTDRAISALLYCHSTVCFLKYGENMHMVLALHTLCEACDSRACIKKSYHCNITKIRFYCAQ